jgi:hypothetical protein
MQLLHLNLLHSLAVCCHHPSPITNLTQAQALAVLCSRVEAVVVVLLLVIPLVQVLMGVPLLLGPH